MTHGQGYELEDSTHPLVDVAGPGVTILEEIRCLVDAG